MAARGCSSGDALRVLCAAGPIVAPKICGSLQLDAIRVNCNGSMVCALASLPGSGGCQDPRLFAYSAGRNGPLVLDLSSDMTAPRAVAWDLSDPRLLAVQTGALVRSQAGSRPNSGDGSCAAAGSVGGAAPATPSGRAATDAGSSDLLARLSDVATVFATDDAGLLLQEYQDLDPASSGCVGFLGVSAPHLLLLEGSAAGQARSATSISSILATVPLRCFNGLADIDDSTRRALLDFNYLLAVGRLEEAFRVVSALKSPAVWRNMAHMAIKNKQLAVAGEPAEPPLDGSAAVAYRCARTVPWRCEASLLCACVRIAVSLACCAAHVQSTAWATCSTSGAHGHCVRVGRCLSLMRAWGWWRCSWASQTTRCGCLAAVSAGTCWSSCRRRQAAGRRPCKWPASMTGGCITGRRAGPSSSQLEQR